MEFSVEQMVELGFRQVFIPQVKTYRPWFTQRMKDCWKCALRVAMRDGSSRSANFEESRSQKQNPFGKHRYYCESLAEAEVQLKRAKGRVAEFLADARKYEDSAPYDITASRIIRCWDYFGGVADKTEVEVQ